MEQNPVTLGLDSKGFFILFRPVNNKKDKIQSYLILKFNNFAFIRKP